MSHSHDERPSRSWVSRLLQVLGSPWVRRTFILAAVVVAVAAVVAEREAVLDALRQVSWQLIVVAVLLAFINVFLAALSWRSVAYGFGAPLSLLDASVVYLVGQVVKYLPGGVLNLVASAELGHDRGVARRRTVGSLLMGALLSATMGGLVILLTLPGARGTPLEDHGWLMLLAPVVLLLVLPGVLNRVLAFMLRITRQEPVEEKILPRTVLVASLWSLLSWVAIGVQVFVLAVAVGAEPSTELLRLSTGGYALAWLVGTAIFFLPAGVGAREAMLALAMAPVLSTGGVLVVVLLSRVIVTVGDLGSAGLALLASRIWSSEPDADTAQLADSNADGPSDRRAGPSR